MTLAVVLAPSGVGPTLAPPPPFAVVVGVLAELTLVVVALVTRRAPGCFRAGRNTASDKIRPIIVANTTVARADRDFRPRNVDREAREKLLICLVLVEARDL